MTGDSPTGGIARRLVALAVFVLCVTAFGPADAAQTPAQWVKAFWPTAKSAGVSSSVYNAALGDFTPDPEVLKKAGSQAEFKTEIWDYLDMTVSEDRIVIGKEMLATHGALLERIESRYGVDRHIVLAIWGVESRYGAVLDNPKIVKSAIRSLATLAYAGGRRAKYGRQQLIAALKIIQRGDISLRGMTGSWAGAMGHTQFIPTTYNAYAVDFDGDGKRNIWNHVDALASTGAYLKKMGWQAGKTWGYEVTLPASFSTKKGGTRTIAEWQKLGLKRANGKPFPRPGDSATLLLPAATKGPAFLVLKNFSVIKRYNVSTSYALAVGHLADRIRGGGPFVKTWPRTSTPLPQDKWLRLQELLAARGYYKGEIDGELGSGSREAIAAYQTAIGMSASGIASVEVLQALEAGK